MLLLGLVRSPTLGLKSRGGAFKSNEGCTFLFPKKSLLSYLIWRWYPSVFHLQRIWFLTKLQQAVFKIQHLTEVGSLPTFSSSSPSHARLQPCLDLRLFWVTPCESLLFVLFVSPGWAHVVCALYIPEVQFANVLTMEPIVLQYVPHDRFNKVRPCLAPAASSVLALPWLFGVILSVCHVSCPIYLNFQILRML